MKTRYLLCIGAIASTVAGCGLNPVKMQPPTLGDTYPVVIEFANALNLPLGAKVAFEGGTVGTVRDVSLGNGAVAVTAGIDTGVTIPGDATAAIVQDTILGDSYVKLTRPDAGTTTASPLAAGSHIRTERTKPPASIEDMMTTLSWFLGTGSLQQMGATLRRVNAALPKTDAETRRVATALSADLRSIAQNSDDLDRTLDNLHHSTAILADRAETLQDLVSDASLDFWNKLFTTLTGVIVIVTSLHSIGTSTSWVLPVLDSSSNMLEQLGVPGGGGGDEIGFTDQGRGTTLLPFLTNPPPVVTRAPVPESPSGHP